LYKYEIDCNFGNNRSEAQRCHAELRQLVQPVPTRREALIGAATNALYDTTNLRVGWFRINGRRR
jgi:type IV pilus assembly protein PilY1